MFSSKDKSKLVQDCLPGEVVIRCLMELFNRGTPKQEAITRVRNQLAVLQCLLDLLAEQAWRRWEEMRLEEKAKEAEGA